MDREISGEDRSQFITKAPSGWVIVDRSLNKIRGYYLSGLGKGVIVARDQEAGCRLLKLKHSLTDRSATLPAENIIGRQYLQELRLSQFNTASRMIRGRDIQWIPEQIYCRIGGNLG